MLALGQLLDVALLLSHCASDRVILPRGYGRRNNRAVPLEPPPSPWAFPDPARAGPDDVVALGADLAPGTVLAGYRRGLFPMHVRDEGREVLAWWSPDPRGVLPLDGLRVSRSLRKARRRFDIRVDTAFEEVITACASSRREDGWINDEIRAAYLRLHHLGWVHSVEAWSREEGTLAGGLYGVAVGGLFAGESMFHRETDASKVALAGLVELLRDGGAELLDVQWQTPHLARLGAVQMSRAEYLGRLEKAVRLPLPAVFSRSS
ncbi:MAG TPA: leucyl/phenylalanyl-tRNA--protein transferase [Acidimicrobiales bacterium]|nr:leucyl/phenylalanyl-tRNA--protein transferase [Acidimicrobiales bacterium]